MGDVIRTNRVAWMSEAQRTAEFSKLATAAMDALPEAARRD